MLTGSWALILAGMGGKGQSGEWPNKKRGKQEGDWIALPASLFLCAEHGANLAGASPATGFYRQV